MSEVTSMVWLVLIFLEFLPVIDFLVPSFYKALNISNLFLNGALLPDSEFVKSEDDGDDVCISLFTFSAAWRGIIERSRTGGDYGSRTSGGCGTIFKVSTFSNVGEVGFTASCSLFTPSFMSMSIFFCFSTPPLGDAVFSEGTVS